MQYRVIIPSNPCDPRRQKYVDSTELLSALHYGQGTVVQARYDTEREASTYLRERLPDAFGMPFVVQCGSGQAVLLGFVADPHQSVDPDAAIPFIAFVQPVTQTDIDRRAMKKGDVFDRTIWSIPVVRPTFASSVAEPIEIRTNDMPGPMKATARVGLHTDGRLTIYVELGQSQVSILFDDKALRLIETAVMDPPTAAPGSGLSADEQIAEHRKDYGGY